MRRLFDETFVWQQMIAFPRRGDIIMAVLNNPNQFYAKQEVTTARRKALLYSKPSCGEGEHPQVWPSV